MGVITTRLNITTDFKASHPKFMKDNESAIATKATV